MDRKVLSNLDIASVIHPKDVAVVSRLNEIPGFKAFLQNTVQRFAESVTDVTYTGNGFGITAESCPQLYNQLVEDCKILGMDAIPKMSALWGYLISSNSVGEQRYRILLASGAVDLLTPTELDFLIGHELGHYLCGHMPYRMLVEAVYSPIFDNADLGIVNLVKFPLLEWYRTSHLSADRVGLLCCQDIHAALSAMIKMSGIPKKYYDKININAFVKQAEEFSEHYGDAMGRIMKDLAIRTAESPWMVLRVKLLMDWYNEGNYKEIVG